MKVLLDACVPRPLRKFLTDHSVHTAQEMGWGQLKNGALLREAEIQFEAFITTDQNLKYQQSLAGRKLAIIVLPTNSGSQSSDSPPSACANSFPEPPAETNGSLRKPTETKFQLGNPVFTI